MTDGACWDVKRDLMAWSIPVGNIWERQHTRSAQRDLFQIAMKECPYNMYRKCFENIYFMARTI